MKIERIALLAALVVLGCAAPGSPSGQRGEIIGVGRLAMRLGDDTSWSRPDLDDSQWAEVSLVDVPESAGVLWLRAPIEVGESATLPGHPFGVYFAALASHEIWWDGELIGRGGAPAATAEEERPGPIQAHYVVPDRLARPGRHVVALRLSAHHRHFRPSVGYWTLLAGDYDEILRVSRSAASTSMISLSGIVLVALFSLVMFLGDRRDRSFLILSLLCLAAALLLFAEGYRTLFGYTYNWHLLRLILITTLTAALNLLLVAFLIVRFPAADARVASLATLAGLAGALVVPGWDGKNLVMFLTGLSVGLVWTVRFLQRKRPGAALALCGVAVPLILLVARPQWFSDLTIFFSVDFLLACLLVSHALEARRVGKEREEALLKSARLEIELLKKHLQPHFLMNTLTALSEWIEKEPKVAAAMIQSLADELRILSEISSRSLIPVAEEIRLCESHLAIMRCRKGCDYRLEVAGIDPALTVPPAVFHTLVENAVTHSAARPGEVVLRLRGTRDGARTRYLFEAPFDGAPAAESPKEGTGLRYLRARLKESYGDRWSLRSGPVAGAWRTEIEVEASGP